jgi:hypothetical protein
MESLLAGLIAGAAMGLIATAFIASILVESVSASGRLRNRFPEQSLSLVAVAGTLGAQAIWAAIGLGMGAIYWAIRDNAQSGAGSPAWGFTLTIALLAGLVVMFAFAARLPAGRRVAVLAMVFVGVFGWLLPNLAEA